MADEFLSFVNENGRFILLLLTVFSTVYFGEILLANASKITTKTGKTVDFVVNSKNKIEAFGRDLSIRVSSLDKFAIKGETFKVNSSLLRNDINFAFIRNIPGQKIKIVNGKQLSFQIKSTKENATVHIIPGWDKKALAILGIIVWMGVMSIFWFIPR